MFVVNLAKKKRKSTHSFGSLFEDPLLKVEKMILIWFFLFALEMEVLKYLLKNIVEEFWVNQLNIYLFNKHLW